MLNVSEWGLIVSIIGVIATVVGLSIAIVQLRKATSAAEAARDAVVATEGRLAKAELLQLIPALVEVDGALEAGIRDEVGADEIAEQLTNWRDKANEVLGVLEGRDYAAPDFLTMLRHSAEEATMIRAGLPETPKERRIVTKDVRAAISSVCGQAGIVKSQLKLRTGD